MLDKIGKKYITNEGYTIEVIEYLDYSNCTIKFEDNRIYKNIAFSHIEEGSIKNPYHPSVCGIGYLGSGDYRTKINNISTPYYEKWKSVIYRCYKKLKTTPTYKDCTVSEEWYNLQNFARWYEENYIDGFHLDKDILVKGNRVYSPETCCFVPREINNLLIKSNKKRGKLPIGVISNKGKFAAQLSTSCGHIHLGYFNTIEEAFNAYKVAKEAHIKNIADKWKGLISEKVYQALHNYKVEITD